MPRFSPHQPLMQWFQHVVALLGILFMASGQLGSARAEELPSFIHDGTLTICTNPTLPPMTFVKGQDVTHPEGFDIDVAHFLATRWHAQLSVITMDFTGLFPSLGAQRCGLVMSGIIRTPPREKSFDAVSYQDTALVVAGRANTPVLTSMDELSGKDVAVESGTSYVTRLGVINSALVAAGKAPMIIQQYPTEEQVVQQVLIGRVFAFVSQDVEIFFRMRQLQGKLHILLTPDIPDYRHFAIYLRQNKPDQELLQTAITALEADETLATLRNKWSIADQSTKPGADASSSGSIFEWNAFFSALTSRAFLHGALITLTVALLSHVIAITLSVPIAIALNNPQRSVLKIVLEGYVALFRAAPTLLQLLFIWNAVPQFFPIFREQWFTPFLATVLALSINESAYQVEINRSALSAVDPGQELGASALGLNRRDIYWRVIFPQAFRIALPPTINEFINLLKITSLASVISLQELLAVTQIQVARTFAFTEYYAAALVYYLVMVFFFLFLQKRVERRFTWSDRKKVVSNAA
ncbi:ABC transporter substrate-binding protein/permease [Acetobacter ascendens]|uniref:Putative glutamine transport system permease protein GlnP n=1 Tax=Acetobacter ascendens TaxID=481146 RepID=A0A1Y0UZM1_9PROT|nr:ABC transporter substrate-binding protein/permease [Acetobacter ascendens]ARW11320.1 Putative glutamine transport system permease protein GlnP [Acetobacter ascendens]GCD75284.1 ABC transporter amino acid transporter permease [Acetobacter pasteurianus NBRC 3299]